MRKTLSFLFLINVFTFSVLAQDKDPQADYDWAQYDFAAHFTLKNGGGKKIFQENKRLFVSNFQVAQIIVANGKQTGQANLAKMTISLSPIDLKAYQAVVDKLYQQFCEQLKAEGYTLISDEEVANSEYAKKQHNGKNIFCMYVKEPSFYKDANGNEVVNIFPTNKYLVANYGAILGNWPSKFGKTFDANIVSIILTINPVSFEGRRGLGSKKGASIEAIANMTIMPSCTASNERGGFGVWGSAVDGKDNWVGQKGMTKADSNTDVFGSVRGTYVLDVKQDVFLSEVEAMGGGLAKGYINALKKEMK
jgi:hypothetical protein